MSHRGSQQGEPSGADPATAARLVRRCVLGAVALQVCVLACCWGEWSKVAGLSLGVIAVSAFNVSALRRSLRRANKEGDAAEVADERPEPVATREAPVESCVTVRADDAATKQAEAELRQSQKLEAVGRLASGIAHEINTPIQFVGDSVHFLGQGIDDLLLLIGDYRQLIQRARGETLPAGDLEALAEAEDRADLEYLKENMVPAVERVREGLSRVTAIVSSMKEFAHPDRKEKGVVDLNRAILATLTIARNEYKYVAELTTELGELPPVKCFVGELNQVILNLVVNAAHAVSDVQRAEGEKGTIAVRSLVEGNEVVLQVSDNGAGIPHAIRERIFDPFFTTKEVGRGTGQGLSIARSVIERHGGSIAFESELGRGTTFTIRIPLLPDDPDDEKGSIAA